MNDKNEDNRRIFWMLGLAITLPMVLLSGPFAGYLISQWLIRTFHWSSNLTLILMLVGLAGSLMQTSKILKQLYQGSNKKDS